MAFPEGEVALGAALAHSRLSSLGLPPGLEDLPAHRGPCEIAPLDAQGPVKLARTAGGRLLLTLADGTPAPQTWKPHSAGGDCQSTASGGQSPGSALDEDEAPKTKKKSRFCKAKRDHYRRLVEQLVEQLRESPETFTLDAAKLPRSIAMCQASREKLLATVTKFAAIDQLGA